MKKKIAELSRSLNLPKEVIEQVYKGYWTFIKTKIGSLPLGGELSEEEFKKLKTNFNVVGLGKFHCTYKEWLGVKKKWRKLNAEHKEDKADV